MNHARCAISTRWVFKWLPIAIVVVGFVSGWFYAGVAVRGAGSEVTLTLDRGIVRVMRMVHRGTPGPIGIQAFGGPRWPPWKWRFRSFAVSGASLSGAVEVPLWPALVVSLAPAAVAWFRRRRISPGHCRGCGYDLAGLTGVVCPECGAAGT